MIRIFDESLNLIVEGNWLDIFKENLKNACKQGDEIANAYFEFCDYLKTKKIIISKDSILDVISMDYDKSCTVHFVDNENDSKLDFWNEFHKYLLMKCKNIFDLIDIGNKYEIEIKVEYELESLFDLIHMLSDNYINVGYRDYKYFLIKH